MDTTTRPEGWRTSAIVTTVVALMPLVAIVVPLRVQSGNPDWRGDIMLLPGTLGQYPWWAVLVGIAAAMSLALILAAWLRGRTGFWLPLCAGLAWLVATVLIPQPVILWDGPSSGGYYETKLWWGTGIWAVVTLLLLLRAVSEKRSTTNRARREDATSPEPVVKGRASRDPSTR